MSINHDEILLLEQDSSEYYKERTQKNVDGADITIAVAVNYSTAGEVLTKRIADSQCKYFMVPYDRDIDKVAHQLGVYLNRNARTYHDEVAINIAGNGIYTYDKSDITQEDVNAYIYHLLSKLTKTVHIKAIRSGGQTGADHAGLVAAVALGIPAIGLYPKGFRRRNTNNEDFSSNSFSIRYEIYEQACLFNPNIEEYLKDLTP